MPDSTPIVRGSLERATVIKPIDYSIHELRFAYCYHVYLRWRTHCGKSSAQLKNLDRETADGLVAKYSIRVLECESGADESRLLVSLRPDESVAVAEGKVKGQVAKWLRQQSGGRFSRGYFACTVGKSTAAKLDDYLASQGDHHHYANRVLPPVFVKTFATDGDDRRLQSPHAVGLLRFHLVLATWRRQGIFGLRAAQAIGDAWRSLESDHRFALLKVSFVPDHAPCGCSRASHSRAWTPGSCPNERRAKHDVARLRQRRRSGSR